MLFPPLEFVNRFNEDFSSRRFTSMVLSCSIEYWGRSRSVIGLGDRLVFVKPDTTLIVHSVSGFKPVNWMSSPTDTIAELVDGEILIHSQRTKKPFEEMKIKVEKVVDYRTYDGLTDKEQLELTHTEADMRDYLARRHHLIHADFVLKSKEYKSPLGFFDLYGKVGDTYTVVELKSERAGLPAALQIKRYRDWLTEHLREEVGGILMAPSIAPNALRIIRKERIEFKKFDIKKIKLPKKTKHTLERWI